MTVKRLNKFSRLNRLTTCRCCGKRTHSSIGGMVGIELCKVCANSGEFENEHSDNDGEHDLGNGKRGAWPEYCPTCAGVSCLHEVKKSAAQ